MDILTKRISPLFIDGGSVRSRKKGVKVVMLTFSVTPIPSSGWTHTAFPIHCVMVSGRVTGWLNSPDALLGNNIVV